MEIKAIKENQKIKGSLELDMDVVRRMSFVECMSLVDIELRALRHEIKNLLIEKVFTRGGKNDAKK